jgi:hypothetical protein
MRHRSTTFAAPSAKELRELGLGCVELLAVVEVREPPDGWRCMIQLAVAEVFMQQLVEGSDVVLQLDDLLERHRVSLSPPFFSRGRIWTHDFSSRLIP